MRAKTLFGLCMTLGVTALFAVTATAQTTTQQTKGTPTVTTEQLRGEVVKVEGNTLVVKMSNGDLRTFSNIPDSRRAIVDGVEVGVRDLKPGTKLTANITKTTTPVTTRTTTVKTAKVWYVSAPHVILTLPDGQNKQYTVKDDFKFVVNGQPATVFDLRPGMNVSAEKIVEEPTVEITTESKVVGQAPTAAPAAAKPAAAATAKPAASSTTSTAKPAAPPPAAAAAPAPAPAAAAPAKLPKTGSPVALMGLLGLLMVGGSLALRRVRQ
jgi:LPXTG-motif cell wall-anchored protein